MTKRSLYSVILFAAGVSAAGVCATRSSHADEPQQKALSCQVQGTTPVKADTLVFDRGSGGTAHAKLTGSKLPLSITHFPNPLKGRVRISTSHGTKSLRIDGWVDRGAIRYFAAADLPVIGHNIWISKGQELKITGASLKGFTVEHKVLGSTDKPLSVNVGCDAVSLAFPAADASEPPERARTYQMKKDSIDLYDKPRGDVIYTLQMDENTRKVFWSSEARGGYLHLISRADITIDAWAKYGTVTYLRHAELFDLAAVAPKPFKSRKLAIKDPPDVVIVSNEVPIHAKPENSPSSIGWLEPGARIYPMEVSGDWTNVMPESLAVLPPDGGGFWVRTSGLPKK
jgi:hypothetical protein